MKFDFGRLLFGVLPVVVVIAAVYVYYDQTRVYTAKIATAEKGNLSNIAGETLARILTRENTRIRLQIVESVGSAESMRLLGEGKVDLAIAQNDIPAVPDARLVAFVYTEVFHLIVPKDSSIQTVADLKGKRVGTPRVGGGSYNSFMTLIKHFDLKPEDFAAFENLSSSGLTKGFLKGNLDAMFSSDPLGMDRQKKVLTPGNARLVPIDQAAAMRLTLPYIQAVTIPKGAYKANPPVPAQDLETVGAQTSLLAHRNLDAHIVQEITRLLFDYRLELAEQSSQLGGLSSPLDAPTLNIAVHEGALAFYNRDKPGFLEENADYIALLLTIATMGASGMLAARSSLSQKRKKRADQYNQEIVTLMEQLQGNGDREKLAAAEQRLFAMFRQVVDDMDHGRMARDSLESFMLTWNQAIQTVRHRQLLAGA